MRLTIRLSAAMVVVAGLLFTALHYIPAAHGAERPLTAGWFDWDRYHARQDACAEKDRLVEACARGDCDELALRQATRECSAWGPGSETISPCIQV